MSPAVILSFLGIALLYSAAGFGGGSSYLAVLSLTGLDYTLLRPVALLCNLAVVGGSVVIHRNTGNLSFTRTLPLVLLSVPAAFLGGTIRLGERVFFVVLGITLTAAALAMVAQMVKRRTASPAADLPRSAGTGEAPGRVGLPVAVALGMGIGFLSGLVGIGGGVFLAPVLHLTRWGRPREIAAATSLFIGVNSAAGLIGQVVGGFPSVGDRSNALMLGALVVAVIIGGQIGSRLTARRLPPNVIRAVTAALILFVGVRLLVQNL